MATQAQLPIKALRITSLGGLWELVFLEPPQEWAARPPDTVDAAGILIPGRSRPQLPTRPEQPGENCTRLARSLTKAGHRPARSLTKAAHRAADFLLLTKAAHRTAHSADFLHSPPISQYPLFPL